MSFLQKSFLAVLGVGRGREHSEGSCARGVWPEPDPGASLMRALPQSSEDVRCKCICPPYRNISGHIYNQNVPQKDW